MKRLFLSILGLAAAAALAGPVFGQEVSFKDPTGDDKGPGNYVYPTDPVYKSGSFDITGAKVKQDGENVEFSVTVNSNLEDPWGMKAGFAVQMAFIFIKTDGKPDGGYKDVPGGLNVKFAEGWNKLVVLSPQGQSRVMSEAGNKAAKFVKDLVVPGVTRGSGRTIAGKVKLADLGGGDITKWGYQVVMQSNEGFPAGQDLLTRRVNEFEGQHRFGGGTDGDCDPHVIDLLAGDAKGDKSEIDAQYKMLAYECSEDGTAKKMATLTFVYKK